MRMPEKWENMTRIKYAYKLYGDFGECFVESDANLAVQTALSFIKQMAQSLEKYNKNDEILNKLKEWK